jgi:hypothetical protein
MSPVVACVVCARPFDSLLTNGLHAGVIVMAVVAAAVVAGIARGALTVLRDDRDGTEPAPASTAATMPR